MIDVYVKGLSIDIGRQGENLARNIYFDLSELINTYGEGTATLVHMRPSDKAPYVCAVTRSDTFLIWAPTSTDTSYAGAGKCELRWVVGDVLAKSIVYRTFVAESITGDSTIPSEYESWYEALLEHISEYEIASDQIEANTRNIATNTNDIAVLDGRVDEITTLPEGSTTGDAELADIRVGADGTVYENAGSAVRGQVEGLKSDINYQTIFQSVIDKPALRGKNNTAITDNGDGTYTVGTTDYGNANFYPTLKLQKGYYLLYGVPGGISWLSTSTSNDKAVVTNDKNVPKMFAITDDTQSYTLGFRMAAKPSAAFTISPSLKRIMRLPDLVVNIFDTTNIEWEYGFYYSDGTAGVNNKTVRSQEDLWIQVCEGSVIALKKIENGERLRIAIYSSPSESAFKERITIASHVGYVFSENCYIRLYMYYSDDREISDFSALTDLAVISILQIKNGNSIVVDNALNEISENPVQNKVITKVLKELDVPIVLPNSWESAIEAINIAKGTKFTFAVQTDTHYYVGYGATSAYNLKLLTNYVGFDFVANMGDVIRGYADETIDSPENMRLAMTDIISRYVTGISCPLMIAMGNHDNNPMWADAYSGEKFSNAELWGRMFKPSFNTNPKAVTYTGKMYYYTDFNDIRVIVLNTQDAENQGFGIGAEQLEWFTNVALSTDKYVLVMSHVPLINGWSVGSNYAPSYAGIVSALQNFKSNGGKLIGCMSGHTHTQESKTVDDILYVTFRNGADLCEVVQVDITNKAINTIPVGFTGAGNRSFTFT